MVHLLLPQDGKRWIGVDTHLRLTFLPLSLQQSPVSRAFHLVWCVLSFLLFFSLFLFFLCTFFFFVCFTFCFIIFTSQLKLDIYTCMTQVTLVLFAPRKLREKWVVTNRISSSLESSGRWMVQKTKLAFPSFCYWRGSFVGTFYLFDSFQKHDLRFWDNSLSISKEEKKEKNEN